MTTKVRWSSVETPFGGVLVRLRLRITDRTIWMDGRTPASIRDVESTSMRPDLRPFVVVLASILLVACGASDQAAPVEDAAGVPVADAGVGEILRVDPRIDALIPADAGIEKLADREREVLVLREFEGLRYREIAALLDIPMGTVMSRLYSARKNLVVAIEETEQ